MTQLNNTWIQPIMEQLIEQGPEAMGEVFRSLFNEAMRIEREKYLGANHYERTGKRRGYANGYQSKRLDTPVGTLIVDVPKTAQHDDAPFYPASLERGRRSTRALLAAVAEMYVRGVSTRRVEGIMKQFGLNSLSSSQVSRATAALDPELQAWRERPLGRVRYLILDARYESVREGGVVVDEAVLSAVGVTEEGRRCVLGTQVAHGEAEINWRAFLEGLVQRGLHGVEYIVSDSHSGLRAALRAVFPGVHWQRCQFHLAQNAIHHAPNVTIRKQIGAELRTVWNALDRTEAERNLKILVARYEKKHPDLAQWLEENVPEGMTVFSLPKEHQRKMRTSNSIERTVQQELKRRTSLVRVFPNRAALLRLVSAILIEIDEEWSTAEKRYIIWNDPVAHGSNSGNFQT